MLQFCFEFSYEIGNEETPLKRRISSWRILLLDWGFAVYSKKFEALVFEDAWRNFCQIAVLSQS